MPQQSVLAEAKASEQRNAIYWEGVLAFRERKSIEFCPYTAKEGGGRDVQRMDWFRGYYEARRIDKWGPNSDEEPLPAVVPTGCSEVVARRKKS